MIGAGDNARSYRMKMTRFLRLTDEEIAYFVFRVRTSSKARPNEGMVPRSRILVAFKAALASLRVRKTCAAFANGIAFMDHSDEGIRQLMERSGIKWLEPHKRQLSAGERLLASVLVFAFLVANWGRVHRAASARPDPIDLRLARDRLLAGSGCFARFLAQAQLGRNAWNGLFVTGDVSFLRMFACFAASRTGRPISVYARHRMAEEWVIPIVVDRLFTLDPSASKNFSPAPATTILEPRSVRRRSLSDENSLDVGIVTDDFVSIENVWAIARECAFDSKITSVRIRLHPRSLVKTQPSFLPLFVRLEDNREPISTFSERIDFALVSMSTSVALLQELLVPCYFVRGFYSTDSRAINLPGADFGLRYSVPEVSTPLNEFLSTLTKEMLTLEVDSLRAIITKEPAEGATTLLRSELKLFLGR